MLFAILSLFLSSAHAIGPITHSGKLDLQLLLTSEKGKVEKLATKDARINISWDSRQCELTTKDAVYPCKLDISQDLTAPNGELLMKALPRVHFDQRPLDQMLMAVGVDDKKSISFIDRVIKETTANRTQGFDVPWYTVRDDGSKSGQPPQFWSAFAGMYLDLPIQAPVTLGAGRVLTLRFHFHDLKASRGAFDIIGNNGVGNFGN